MSFSLHGVRYQTKDVRRAVDFYTNRLGFDLVQQVLPAFAMLSLGPLKLLLTGPGASGSRTLPDGRTQEPGGWNRIVVRVDDLDSVVAALQRHGCTFRNAIESGVGGRQIQIEDPDGNPVELFEAGGSR